MIWCDRDEMPTEALAVIRVLSLPPQAEALSGLLHVRMITMIMITMT
jgi:hypothetical protein